QTIGTVWEVMSAGDGAELKRSPAPQLPDIKKSKTHKRSSERTRLTPAPQFPHPPRYRAQVNVDSTVDSAYRPRRTCMSVPASSERFLAKARDVTVDEVMLDLEDSVAPAAKSAARDLAVGALKAGGFGGELCPVPANRAATPR